MKNYILVLFCLAMGMAFSCKSLTSAPTFPLDSPTQLRVSLDDYYASRPSAYLSEFLSASLNRETLFNTYFDDRADSAFFAPFLDSLHLKYSVEWEFVDHLVRFVQESFSYDDNNPGEVIKYPYQTFVSRTGICSDRSVLLGKLLVYAGYSVAFFAFEKAEHVALGLKVPQGYGSYNSPWIYIETTNIRPLGDIPHDSFGPDALTTPEIIPVHRNGNRAFTSVHFLINYYSEASRLYGDDYLFLDQQSRYLSKRIHDLRKVADSLQRNVQTLHSRYQAFQQDLAIHHQLMQQAGCQGVVSDDSTYAVCAERVEKYNALVEQSNALSLHIANETNMINLLVEEMNNLVETFNRRIIRKE
ncbi:MAG: hypothetical protein PHU97_03230 [Bacteroidales bacterium]|nr:hypothetical protein [Bacteroidales bacterium]MDD3010314.1 hypothetical protein [Bacteroidales bacterium]MDY0284635.1 hypothetical protein [Bacteroidales bacterium]HPE85738.1 hypothetical protein [Bacteroidales bacterium]